MTDVTKHVIVMMTKLTKCAIIMLGARMTEVTKHAIGI